VATINSGVEPQANAFHHVKSVMETTTVLMAVTKPTAVCSTHFLSIDFNN